MSDTERTQPVNWQCTRCKRPPEDCECPNGFLIVNTDLYEEIQALLDKENK